MQRPKHLISCALYCLSMSTEQYGRRKSQGAFPSIYHQSSVVITCQDMIVIHVHYYSLPYKDLNYLHEQLYFFLLSSS